MKSQRRSFVGLGLGLGGVLASALLAGWAAPAAAQEAAYPNKPINLIVPFPAGSGTDQLGRMLGQVLAREYKVPVVVENKAGASGFLAAQHVAKAAPDGYTVLLTTNTTHAANEHLFKKIPYDPVKDFAPVALLSKGYMLLVVKPDSPHKTATDLVNAARQSPGKLNFGSGSSSSRVASELLSQMASLDVVNVPYKSNPMALTDLMGGQIDYMFVDAPTAVPQVQAGKVRALAASGLRRLPATPEVPTVDEAGIKGYDMSYWSAVYMPAGTPEAIVNRFNAMLKQVHTLPEAISFNEKTSGEVSVSTPAGLAAFQAQESAKWARVIQRAGIQPE